MNISAVNKELLQRGVLEPGSDGNAYSLIRLPGLAPQRCHVVKTVPGTDEGITEAQKEHAKIKNNAAPLANTVLEEKWNEAAKALLETGGKLCAARRLINRDPVALLKLEIPEQGERFGSWTYRELVDRSNQHSLLDLLAA